MVSEHFRCFIILKILCLPNPSHLQVFVVCCVFFAAKLTTIHGRDHEGNVDFLFYVPQIVQTLLLETGLLACVVVVIVAQLMPQIVASLYPIQVGSRYVQNGANCLFLVNLHINLY